MAAKEQPQYEIFRLHPSLGDMFLILKRLETEMLEVYSNEGD